MTNLTEQDIARVAYESLRAYQQAAGDPVPPPWEQAEPWRRESAAAGVACARGGASPAQQHEAWVRWRAAAGWTPGPRDDAARTHPNMVDWGALPPEEWRKDVLFVAVVNALA